MTTATPYWSTYQTPHFIHTPLQCCTTRQKLEAKGSHLPRSSAPPTGFPSKREFHSKSVSSCSTSIPGHFRVTYPPWSHRAQKSNRDRLPSARASLFGRRAFAVAGSSEWNNLPVSLRHAPSIESVKLNQTKNSSFSNLLRIIYFVWTYLIDYTQPNGPLGAIAYSGHCALNNVKRFRIKLVFS